MSTSTLHRREQDEHVVLCDCRNAQRVISSQMAYYRGPTTDTPEDVAIVTTSPGQARLWANAETTGLFTNSGVSFTSYLGPQVAEGRYAGPGKNDYGPFTCWRRFVQNLYTYDGTTCSQAYDCTHEAAPTNNGTVPDAVPVPTETPGSNTNITPKPRGGLAPGAEAAIIAGSVVGVLIASIAGLLLFLRWYRLKRGGGASALPKPGWKLWRLFVKTKKPAEPGAAEEPEKDPAALPEGMAELPTGYYGHELYEEMFDELDGNARAELAARRSTEAQSVQADPRTGAKTAAKTEPARETTDR